MNPFTFIGDIARAIGAFFGYSQHRSEINNSPEMKKRDEMQKEIYADDQDDKNITERNLDDSRNSLS